MLFQRRFFIGRDFARRFFFLSGVQVLCALVALAPLGSRAACVPAPSGLVSWWPGEGTGNDIAGNNPGILQNGTGFAAGEVGQAFNLNGANSYVQVADSASLRPAQLTLEVWVYPRSFRGGSWDAIISHGAAGGGPLGCCSDSYFLGFFNGQPDFETFHNGTGNDVLRSATPLAPNQWYHLAATFDGTNKTLYVNGVAVTNDVVAAPIVYEAGVPLVIGEDLNNGNPGGIVLNGLIDEVSLYNRALAAGEALSIFNAGTAGKCGATLPGAGVPYFTDFENGIGPEWGVPLWNGAETLGFTHFTGRFDNGAQTLVLTNLVIGQAYTVGFDFYALDSLDGTYGGSGDFFNVSVNGTQVFHYTFSNYNGNPPNNPQSFPGQPDEGRANFGFIPSYVDAIYRNIEISFVASNAVTVIAFSGQNLEAVDNESWGIDNVGVRLSSDLTNTFIRSTSLPPAGSTNNVAIENFTISANWPLLASSATNTANYVLRDAGADGILGNGDDVIYPLTASLPGPGGRSVAFAIANPPLQPGKYRFQTTSGLLDTNSTALPVFTRDFVIANPALGKIETPNNSTLVNATPLPTAESPAGSGFFTAFAVGTFSSTSDVDYWSFNAEAGDVLTVRVESESQGVYPQIYLQNSAGGNINTFSGDYTGVALFQNLTISTPGTYYLRVFSNNNRSRYWMRLDQSRGPQMESESNDTQGSANAVNLAFSPGLYQGHMVGSLPVADTAGDFFKLGTLNVGNSISVTALFPTGSVLNASQTVLGVQLNGNTVDLVTNTTGNLNYTVVSNGIHYIHVTTPNPNLRAQYLLNIAVVDGVPPVITAANLPAEGTTTTAIVDRFTLNFSEDIYALSLSNSANYELRSAGPDGIFGTADDALYHVVVGPAGYTSGLTASYSITDGPLQVGNYRFTVSTNLLDRAANQMAAPFVRNFTVANLPGYVLETRTNTTAGLGTSLSPAPTTNSDGTIGFANNVGTDPNPEFIAAGRLLTGSTNLQLVTANWNGHDITVLTNNGAGVFSVLTNITTGNNPVSLALGDFNKDNKLDIAVANYSSGTVTILLGDGNGGFTAITNIPGFNAPYNLMTDDFNGDGKLDLAVPNYNSSTISVLLGNGDGTFGAISNYVTGNNPEAIASADLNNDNKKDLVVVNYSSSTATILLGNGNGTFQIITNLATGANPRYVAIADVTGDNVPDIITLQGGENTVSVFAGVGDGTFQARRYFYSGAGSPYDFALVDLNGDGFKDIVVPGYGNNQISVLFNNGTGYFTNLSGYGTSQNPIGVAAGDFNGDGRTDLAFCHYNGNYVSIWLGNPISTLLEDPPGSGLRTAFARGSRANSSDVDYYQFSGNAGDQVILAVDVPGNPAASSLSYYITRLDGTVLTSFSSDYTGWGQSSVVTLPQTGTYLVRVQSNYDYQGEYRIRLTIARPPLQLQNEGNNSIASANPVVFTLTNNAHLTATLAGYVNVADSSGDYYNLGNLVGGSSVGISFRAPVSSGLSEDLWIYNSSGVLMTNGAAGATNFVFTVPVGQDGVYYAQVTAAPGGYSGNSDTALRFNGGNNYADLGTWFNYQTFTLSMWLAPGATQTGYADILDNQHTSVNWVIEQNNNNVNQYTWGADDGSTSIPFSLAANAWQHLAITHDGTNVNRVYINGTLVGTSAGTGQIFYDGNQSLHIAHWGYGGRNWNGTIDEFRVWNRALSQSEIIAGMTGSLTGAEPNLAGYWRFNEGAGTNAFDSSPSNHTAYLYNNPAWVFISPTNALPQGLQAQYILGIDVTNAVAPAITGVTLPADSTTSTNIITSFTVSFSEDMDPVFNHLTRNIFKFNGHSYLLTDSSSAWQNAEAMAVSLGGHLTAINSQAENTWLNQTFSGNGEFWTGLNDYASKGTWAWSTGEPVTYNNWYPGQPDDSGGNEDAAKMYTGGQWDDVSGGTGLLGVIEVAGATDTDGDGLVDSLDPYPNDPLNAFDLRAAGPDGLFDTADDVVYRVYTTGYVNGLSAPFVIADGPLQPGNYRFKVTTSLKDRFGNPLSAPFTRLFTVAPVGGFIEEARRGIISGTSTTSLSTNPSNQLDGSFTGTANFSTPSNPYFIAQGYLNGDTNLDLVTCNYGSGNITIFLGDGTGSFQATTNIATGGGPISAVIADFNGDNKMDLAVANYNSGTITILLGDGNGGFQVFTNYGGFSNPENLATADFNHDNKLDLAVPNVSNGQVTILFGNGDGSFHAGTNYPTGSQPNTVAIGDVNGDNQPDLVVANYGGANVSVLLGNPDGTFQAATNFADIGNPRYATLGDVNGDNHLDIVAVSNGKLSVFLGNGNGTFQPRADYSIPGNDAYQVVLADINGDNTLDAIVAGYSGNRLVTVLNNGDGTFGPINSYNPGGNPISVVVGDFNHDGRLDLATVGYYGNYLSIFLGNNQELIALDPGGTGIRVAAARGNLADSGDVDYWTFTAQTGDQLFVASETVGSPNASGLHYQIYTPDGQYWTDFYGDYNGRGQLSAAIPVSGTYTIRVSRNNSYYGEYRIRVSLARPPVQLEVEDNSSIANANTLSFALSGGRQTATVLGYIGLADGSGDFFRLGNLADGTQITLGLSRPANSALAPVLEIYNPSSQLVTNSLAGQTNLVYPVAIGSGGSYYAHVTWNYTARNPVNTNGLYFNGNNAHITVGNWSPGPTWSIQAWVMPASLPGGRRTIAGGLGNCQDWGLSMQDGHFGAAIRPPGGCNVTIEAPTVANPGSWYYVASVSDGTNAYVYVNGVLTASGPVDSAYAPTTGGTWIGGESCCGDYFPGIIQDVSIWNRALSQTEINNFMASSPNGSESGLIGYWRLQDGAGTTVTDLSSGGHNGTLVNNPTWSVLAPFGSIPAGILEEYLLSVSLLNTIAPQVVSVSLPAEGTASTNILDRFSIAFSEDMGAATVTNSANYDLRNAGPDNLFGTADDQLYGVVNSPAYTSGTSASYLVTNGPLQPGMYRFTVSTNLTDRVGNNLTNVYVRNFSVVNVPGFVLETRTNNALNLATSLSPFLTNKPDGSLLGTTTVGVGSGPYYLAAGRINNDTNLDLAVANYNSSTVSILLGDGAGGFQLKTNLPAGNNAICPVLGLFNADANLDLAVANYNAGTVSVYMGSGDGNFLLNSNYNVGTQPNFVATGDFDHDGKLDLVTANYSSSTVSVLLGKGDGTFKPAVSYPAGSQPIMVAVGDVNGDGKPDLVTANYNNDNVTLLLGNGDGSFAPAVSIPSGRGPRAVALADLNNDGKLDLIVFNGAENTLSIMFGNGDGSFQPRVILPAGTSDGYQIAIGDFDGDGLPDIAVTGYYNGVVAVFLNQGGGQFGPREIYGTGYNAVGLVAGDFNNDGRLDLAVSDYNNSAITVFLGNASKPLQADPPLAGFRMAAGRGNISDDSDVDYYNFSAQSGDLLLFGADSPGNFSASGQRFVIYNPDGSQLTSLADYYGRIEFNAALTQSGTYTILVQRYYQYTGEYRFRVTLGTSPLQLESEGNDSVGQADGLTFTSSGGHRTAGVMGQISTADTSGDFFALGNLSPGANINLNYAQPNSSPLVATLGIYNSSGSLVTNSPAGVTNLAWAVTSSDAYYARITSANNSAGLFAVYVLNIDIGDVTPPAITANTLPASGSTNLGIVDRFTLSFNKDLDLSINGINRYIRLYGGHAYTVTGGGSAWYNAETQARALGGHLAAMDNPAENAWVNANFSSFGNVWIGLTDEAQRGTYVWTAGDALTYTNWSSGQPNDSGNQDYVVMFTDGTWADYNITQSSFRGVIEVSGADSDGDGIPDTLDPFPYDPFNLADLRAAGPDGVFDTADDQIYHLSSDNYTSGLSLNFYVTDGPLQPGSYRLTVTSSMRDRFGNTLAAPYVRFFTVGNLPGYVFEGRTNTTSALATTLALTEDPPGMKSAAGRGKLFDGNDVDYWSFTGTAGDLFMLGSDVPGNPSATRLHYEVFQPNGSRIIDLIPNYNGGYGQTTPIALPTNGVYNIRVTPYDGYYGEYHLRVTTVTPPLQMETEDNGSIAAANAVTLNTAGNASSASLAGYVRNISDLDYFNLGTVSNGYTIFLSVRQPAGSPLAPIVSVYNSANAYQAEAPGGRPDDGVAEVRITQKDTYYAVVRGGPGSGGLDSQYVLDVQVVPTGAINFPNLVVSAVNPPTGSGILSGQPITYTYTVQNIGSLATQVGNWVDRAALSTDTILGNGDDIPLGFFPHTGVLNPGDNYSVTNMFTLPDGISGDYYVIVYADAGNAVNEYLFEGDNITVSSATFHVNVAPYPDLRVENLAVTGPDVNNVFTITWNTANRGNAAAPAGFMERFLVRNQTSGVLLTNVEQTVAGSIAVNATLPHQMTVVATNGGVYQVQVTTDSENNIFEYDTLGHADAEANNTSTTTFQILSYFNVSVQSLPPGAGLLTGGGTYASGSTVTVNATPNTNTLPYQFVDWTEGGAFQSAVTNYIFIISRDRTLTANFTLPSFQLSASNNPPVAGTVIGQGTYFYGTTNVLTANANFGYLFTNWTANGSVISLTPNLTNIVTSNLFVVANYGEANTIHVVTTGTTPTNVAAVVGAGTYTNGQSANFSAPLSVTNPPNIYNFKQFQLNGAFSGNNASFNKTFTTLDPTNLQFIAVYATVSILPLVTNVSVNYHNLVPATTNFILSLQFNRGMDTNFTPLVALTNPVAAVQATVPAGGTWSTSAVSNDTFTLPPITFSTGMDGTNTVYVSNARDLNGGQLALTNALTFAVDVTPPPGVVMSLIASNSSSATMSWSGYAAPPDLNGFRVYLSAASFNSVSGLTAVSSLGSAARGFTYGGLSLDQPYYAAVVGVDNAGNSLSQATPLAFTIPSSVPPPAPVQVAAVGPSSALVSWNGYDTSALLGFSGFKLYYQTSGFASVSGLTPKQTLGVGARSVQIDNLDRTKTWYFAVVGFNGNNAFNPNVTTATWSDPYAGNISANTSIGGAGQNVVDILQTITLVNNAVLTIQPGTTLRFAPGAGLLAPQGSLNANGTPLDPITFTSANDQPGLTPAAGDWNGITLGDGAGASLLRDVFVKYGAGLTLSNCAPTVDAFTAMNNISSGLNLIGGAMLNTTNALLINNGIGARQLDSSQLTIINSVIKNNGTNAFAAAGGATVNASGDWWGSAVASDIAALVQGPVNTANFLVSEPLLTPAIGTLNNVTQVGSQSVNLRLACRTADSMRLSEDSAFNAVFFSTFTNAATFPLSSGGGLKTVFAQFRSITGQTSAPVSVTINYITAGPTINLFSLSEGEALNRPLLVTGGATAPLGMAAMEFYVDGVGQGTNAGGSFSQWFDVRGFSSAVHRVELLARDNSGNFATLQANVAIAPTPPPAPVITYPATDLIVNSNSTLITGTAEPLIQVKLYRSGTLLGTTNASAAGGFAFTNAPLVEGTNLFTAVAVDSLGSAGSLPRSVVLDTIPPAQLVMDPPSYRPGAGLTLSWHYPATGKHAGTFQVFWSKTPITSAGQAIGNTLVLPYMNTTLQGLASGNYYFYVIGFDALGNQSPLSDQVQFFYDAVPPSFNVAFDKASPVSVGPLHVTIIASKPINGAPTLTVQPSGSSPSLLALTNTSLNTYESSINVTTLLPSGPVQLNISAVDTSGNQYNGPPTGPALVIDVTPPSGAIATAPLAPVQATNNTAVSVNLVLTKPAKTGTTPTLNFGPPIGAPTPVTLTGSGTTWNGTLTVTPAMGSGVGHFTLTVSDALDNIGHAITSGSALEIYNTALPTPPAQPVGFQAASLSGGRVQLSWFAVPNAEIYRVYSEPGTNFLITPAVLVADNITSNNYIDLPATDGYYRYSVTASRRGSEGTNSIVRVALSDRTPPPAPVNVAVQLAATGLQITWQAGAGETPDHFNIYRNGTLIRTVGTVTPVIDNPPRGIMNYTVAAADILGNEALSASVPFQLLVSAVDNLHAQVTIGQAPALSWTSSDPTAVGFNVYRNGIKQNASPLAGMTFTDNFPPGSAAVTYAITALNSTNAESAARSVAVYPVDLAFLVNAAGGPTNNPPTTAYFDDYQVTVSNLTATSSFPLGQINVQRLVQGADSADIAIPVNGPVGVGNWYATDFAVPCSSNTAPQSVWVRAQQQTDSEGSSVVYQKLFNLPAVQTPGTLVDVSVNQLPLAGGLNSFNLRVYNRGFTPMYFATTRGSGSQPGDVYISVKNPLGQEVSRTPFSGTPSGIIFDGPVGYLQVPPGGSTSFTVPGVLVPAALASNTVTFQAVVSAVYDRPGANGQQQSGPLLGSMQSSLSQTPYYGSAQTDQQLYSNDQPVIITGQALDRITSQPVPNVPLRIGFGTRGYHWYRDVTTDTNGNYSYIYNPGPGLAGTLMIWAAHPDVVDQLNQTQITIYRLYASPSTGDIKMSKNDTQQFSIGLINPGDLALNGFTIGFQAYQMQGTNQVPITTVHGALLDTNLSIAAGARPTVNLQLAADANAPDNAIVVFTLTSAQGASATFTGNIALLPAVPVITVTKPDIGYVEVSVDRGTLLSRQVTIMNRGLKDLKGVSIIPPTNVTWMTINLPPAPNGTIPLPDLLVGQSNTITVVFAPPTNTDLGFSQDKFTVVGTNAIGTFDVNLYAKVTSSQVGAVQFYVDDLLGLDVANATVRLRNTALQVELPPVQTDINGLVTVTNLQEGDWSWQISAPGHSVNVGVVTVVPDQTVNVSTRLNVSVVTVNFTVVPVPFTDRYEITLEQTFDTHVPLPVLVLTPNYQNFDNVTPGFQASFIVTAKNQGLIQMENLTFTGSQDSMATFTPLITYVPVLLPQQSIEVPFTVTYLGTNAPSQQDGNPFVDCLPNPLDFLDFIGPFTDGLRALANAEGRCVKDNTLLAIAGAVAMTMKIYQDVTSVLASIPEQIASYIGCLIGSLLSNFGGFGGFGAGSGGGQESVQNFQQGGAGCFAPDTRVLLADGRCKTIDQIKAGDVVKSGTGRNEISTVSDTYTRLSKTVREIRFQPPGSQCEESVRTTDEHLFWVDGKGWLMASQLQVGQWLFNDQGRRVQITASERIQESLLVYNLKLRGDVAFYANGILVHDLCGDWSPDGPAFAGSLPGARPVNIKVPR
jgi:methionine-rich copper-binding protein CopC